MTTLTQYAWSFLGVPYTYGGNSRVGGGMDCSGYLCEILRSVGIIGKGDYSSQMLYEFLKSLKLRSQLAEGSVLFFGASPQAITHVSYAISDLLMLECGGGTRTTVTIEEARRRNACVRLRPITSRNDLVACLKLEVKHE